MRKSPTGSLSSVEDVESSVLPMRGIRKGKRELGKILFLHPLLQSNPKTLLGFLLEFSTKYNSSQAKPIAFMSCLVALLSLGRGFEMVRRLAFQAPVPGSPSLSRMSLWHHVELS